MRKAREGQRIADNLSNSQIEHLIDEWCHNQKYREILKLRFIHGMTFEAIAESWRLCDNIIFIRNRGIS